MKNYFSTECVIRIVALDRAIAEAPDGVIISIPSNTVVDTALTKLANAGAPPPCPPAAHLPAGPALTPPRRAQA